MRLACYIDQVFWQDEEGYSSDEAHTLFLRSLVDAPGVDELVLIGRAAAGPGRRDYALPQEGVQVLTVPHYPSVPAMWRRWPQVRRAARQLVGTHARSWDLLMVHGPHPVAQVMLTAAAKAGTPVALVVRQNLIEQVRHGHQGAQRRLGVPLAAVLEARFRWAGRGRIALTIGQEMTDAYARWTREAFDHHTCLVDDARLRELQSRPRPAEADTARRLLFVGRLSNEKGLPFLFEALVRLRAGGQPVSLDLVGSGRAEASLRELVNRLNLGELVTFWGHVPNGPALIERYRAATALVVPSLAGEGFPQVINEAMCVGLPVVATRVGGVPAVLRDEVTALLLPPADVDALTATLHRLLADADLRARLGAAGQQSMVGNTLEAHRDRFVAILRQEVAA